MRSFEWGRADLRNIPAFLRTHKEREGPRALMLTLDYDGRIVDGECGGAWFRYKQLRGGPCRHLLAMRKAQG